MKKLLLLLLPPILACIVFFGAMFYLAKADHGKGALQVTSSPKASVYLDGKFIGKTPFCKCDLPDMIATGAYTLRLVPDDSKYQPFEQQIPINKSVITVVDVSFEENNNTSASIISLNPLEDAKSIQLFVTSFPDNATVFVDKNKSGQTPATITDITDSNHDILLEKDGYQSKVLHVHTVKGYKLSAIGFLAVKSDLNATSSAEASVSATINQEPNTTPTPSPKTKQSPTPTSKVTPQLTSVQSTSGNSIIILQTPTGYLNVRASASPYAQKLGQVSPGQTFNVLDHQNGWYEISLSNGTKGWVSGQYVRKQ